MVIMALIAILSANCSQSNIIKQKSSVSFTRDVLPIIRENCFGCHNSKQKFGKYDMTTYEKMLSGGLNGDAIIPGDLESEFYRLIVTNDERRMPPRHNMDAVNEDEANIIRKWIREGAKLDLNIKPDTDLMYFQLQDTTFRATGGNNAITAITYHPRQKKIIAASCYRVKIFNEEGNLLSETPMPILRATSIQVIGENQFVISGGTSGEFGALSLYNIDKSNAILSKHLWITNDVVTCSAIDENETIIAAASFNQDVVTYNLKSLDRISIIDKLHTEPIQDISIKNDTIATISGSMLKVWKFGTPSDQLSFSTSGQAKSVRLINRTELFLETAQKIEKISYKNYFRIERSQVIEKYMTRSILDKNGEYLYFVNGNLIEVFDYNLKKLKTRHINNDCKILCTTILTNKIACGLGTGELYLVNLDN